MPEKNRYQCYSCTIETRRQNCMNKTICIITGTRAEYGLLKPLIHKIHEAEDLNLQLAVTGMHLSPEFGLTYKEIEADGYPITSKIEMLLSSEHTLNLTQTKIVGNSIPHTHQWTDHENKN